jgi:hypothetical protein
MELLCEAFRPAFQLLAGLALLSGNLLSLLPGLALLLGYVPSALLLFFQHRKSQKRLALVVVNHQPLPGQIEADSQPTSCLKTVFRPAT